ncbi:hypothetical protein J6590_106218 [Homalodisca vitripennis]|nr:hypothetical protein J6590_106218 [Homalodisca vitripennis]
MYHCLYSRVCSEDSPFSSTNAKERRICPRKAKLTPSFPLFLVLERDGEGEGEASAEEMRQNATQLVDNAQPMARTTAPGKVPPV